MSHDLRKRLESDLKHALKYSGRFLMHGVSNFWQTCKGQQLFQLAIIAAVSLGLNIYYGVIEKGKEYLTLEIAMYFGGTIFFLTVLWSLVRVPFQLDQERIEEIDTLNSNLSLQRLPETTPPPQSTEVSPPPVEKKGTPPTIVFIETDLVYVEYGDSRVQRVLPPNMNDARGRVLVAKFHSQPVTPSSTVYIKASMTIKARLSTEQGIIITEAAWLDHWSDEHTFRPGEYRDLIIGFVEEKSLYLCSRTHLQGANRSYTVAKNFEYTFGKEFDVRVEMWGTDLFGAIVLPTQKFRFTLDAEQRTLRRVRAPSG